MKRSCDHLGVCRSSTSRCGSYCRAHFFAPGAVERYQSPRRRNLQLLKLWGLRVLFSLAALRILLAALGVWR